MHPLPRPLPVTVLLMHVAAWKMLGLLYMLFEVFLLANAPA
jgi:hypothetical protein